MSDFVLNENQIQQFDTLNAFFEENKAKLSNILTFDNLVNEAHVLNTLESNIPESLRFDLHFDLILNRGVTDYYQTMSSGKNYILEAARTIFPNSKQITESIESFKEYLVSMLHEEALALGMPTPGAALTAPLKPRTGGGFWNTLKSLWNAVTEGGSVIGIIHFIIDIIGLVGDFIFPGVGVVADIINAIIYAIRGEWMLCAISIIAGVVIGAGDALKLFKFAAKPAEKVMITLAKEGGAEAGAKMISKLPAKEKGGVMKLLTSIAGYIGGAMGKATSLLGKFFENFGKVTKWIPGLGGALNWIFKGLGSTITKFGDKMSLFSANLKLATASAKKSAAISIDQAIKNGGDLVIDGSSWMKVINKDGKVIGKYPVSQFDNLTGDVLINATAKQAGSKESAKILYKTGKDVAKTKKVLENPKVQDSLRRRAYTFFEKTPLKKGFRRVRKDLPFFIGKQIYKLIHGSPWIDGESNSKWTRKEVEGHGNGAINDWINQKLKDERDKTGAVYVPALTLDSQDQDVYKNVTDYQNHFAKLYGQPNMMQVVTKNYDKEGAGQEFATFFDEIAKGNVTHGGKGDVVSHASADTINKSTSLGESKKILNITTILNFSDFKK